MPTLTCTSGGHIRGQYLERSASGRRTAAATPRRASLRRPTPLELPAELATNLGDLVEPCHQSWRMIPADPWLLPGSACRRRAKLKCEAVHRMREVCMTLWCMFPYYPAMLFVSCTWYHQRDRYSIDRCGYLGHRSVIQCCV